MCPPFGHQYASMIAAGASVPGPYKGCFHLDYRRTGLGPVSKASADLSKWLILRARQQTDAGVELRPAGAHSAPAAHSKASRPRSPTGEPGLPCDWLFSVAVEPVIIVDAMTNRIVQANPAAAQLLRRPHTGL